MTNRAEASFEATISTRLVGHCGIDVAFLIPAVATKLVGVCDIHWIMGRGIKTNSKVMEGGVNIVHFLPFVGWSRGRESVEILQVSARKWLMLSVSGLRYAVKLGAEIGWLEIFRGKVAARWAPLHARRAAKICESRRHIVVGHVFFVIARRRTLVFHSLVGHVLFVKLTR